MECLADSDSDYEYGMSIESKGEPSRGGESSGIIVTHVEVIRHNVGQDKVNGSGKDDILNSGDELESDRG